MRLQIALEDLFVQLGTSTGEKTVILNDRGLLDSKFFAGEEDFADILFNNNWSEEQLLGRYDLVIHLVTAALGAETFYTTEGNVARWETPAQAAEQDNALKSCWMGHRHHYTVDNSDTFTKKIRKATKIICEEIGVEKPSPHKMTFLLKGDVPPGLIELDKQFLFAHGIKDDVQFHKLTTTFLVEGTDGSNKVLRRRERNGMSTFLLTTEIKDEKGHRVLLEDPLRRAMYQSLLRGKDPDIQAMKRNRYIFVCENHFLHELDVHADGLVRLMVAGARKEAYGLPSMLQTMTADDVSDDPKFASLRGLSTIQNLAQLGSPAKAARSSSA